MIVSQTINEFIAFKAIFNMGLLKAIENKNIFQVKFILNTDYKYETENNFYIKGKIDLNKVEQINKRLGKEIESNKSLIHNL